MVVDCGVVIAIMAGCGGCFGCCWWWFQFWLVVVNGLF